MPGGYVSGQKLVAKFACNTKKIRSNYHGNDDEIISARREAKDEEIEVNG